MGICIDASSRCCRLMDSSRNSRPPSRTGRLERSYLHAQHSPCQLCTCQDRRMRQRECVGQQDNWTMYIKRRRQRQLTKKPSQRTVSSTRWIRPLWLWSTEKCAVELFGSARVHCNAAWQCHCWTFHPPSPRRYAGDWICWRSRRLWPSTLYWW